MKKEITIKNFDAICKRGLPGHRTPLLILGNIYAFRIKEVKFKFSFFNYTNIVVFWMDNGKRGTSFDRQSFYNFFHPGETLENFLIRLESEKYNL